MKKAMISLIGACVLLSLALPLSGQTHYLGGGSFTMVIPQNEFSENVDNWGFGFTGYFAYNFPSTPLYIGASFGFSIYGSQTTREPLITPLVMVEVTTTNSLINGHAFLRLQPPRGDVRPYVDGLVGFNFLSTDTRISDEDDYEEIASSNNFRDITYSYGVGGGFMIKVWKSPDGSVSNPVTLFLDLGIRYLRGGEAEYLKEGSIDIVGNDVIFDVSKSTTDMITAHIGVSVAF